jgi:cytoskeletal protein CcmA (bactofilin family)
MFTRRDPNDLNDAATRGDVSRSASVGGEGESLIAAEDTFEGQIQTTTGVRVQGTVRGSITSQRSVSIDEGAQVEADITAEEVVIAGTYSGSLTCRNRVEITSTARVSGKIDTAKMHLHEGGYFDGELHMRRNQGEASRQAEAEDARPRRTRYVDINSETPRTVTEGPSEPPKQEEAAA